ncbi:hypothetical protein L1987_45930 [Smallanthus sonchifolius]|uniref:Uncharacterized protein n=1 Tax=Smallanthus sonchifolius TaxID=185202 RepID=A0ACB9FZB2_9ASTR|nr:hypothetical protein L1987_45930 [Smallanthus sonchifolius]
MPLATSPSGAVVSLLRSVDGSHPHGRQSKAGDERKIFKRALYCQNSRISFPEASYQVRRVSQLSGARRATTEGRSRLKASLIRGKATGLCTKTRNGIDRRDFFDLLPYYSNSVLPNRLLDKDSEIGSIALE